MISSVAAAASADARVLLFSEMVAAVAAAAGADARVLLFSAMVAAVAAAVLLLRCYCSSAVVLRDCNPGALQ